VDKVLGGAIALGIIVVALTAMFFAWRARSARAARFVMPAGEPGEPSLVVEVFYVATTLGENHLERVSLPGLAYRGYGSVAVSQSAIALTLKSADRLIIPRETVTSVGVTTTVIDKVVEKDGILSIRWNAVTLTGETTELATHIRLPRSSDRADLLAALGSTNALKEKEGSL
jgi:hypothetical protein